MNDWLMAPAFEWLPAVPWWGAFLICFALGAFVGWLIKRARTEAKLASGKSQQSRQRAVSA